MATRAEPKQQSAVSEKRRQELVLAAYREIAQRGFEGLRTREVAAEVGVNIATLTSMTLPVMRDARRGDLALRQLEKWLGIAGARIPSSN